MPPSPVCFPLIGPVPFPRGGGTFHPLRVIICFHIIGMGIKAQSSMFFVRLVDHCGLFLGFMGSRWCQCCWVIAQQVCGLGYSVAGVREHTRSDSHVFGSCLLLSRGPRVRACSNSAGAQGEWSQRVTSSLSCSSGYIPPPPSC